MPAVTVRRDAATPARTARTTAAQAWANIPVPKSQQISPCRPWGGGSIFRATQDGRILTISVVRALLVSGSGLDAAFEARVRTGLSRAGVQVTNDGGDPPALRIVLLPESEAFDPTSRPSPDSASSTCRRSSPAPPRRRRSSRWKSSSSCGRSRSDCPFAWPMRSRCPSPMSTLARISSPPSDCCCRASCCARRVT